MNSFYILLLIALCGLCAADTVHKNCIGIQSCEKCPENQIEYDFCKETGWKKLYNCKESLDSDDSSSVNIQKYFSCHPEEDDFHSFTILSMLVSTFISSVIFTYCVFKRRTDRKRQYMLLRE
ncbi:hypothetical protein WA158_003054 [Blastocystis sp. Blastoise]